MFFRSSLSRETLLAVGIRLAAVILLITVVGYLHFVRSLRDQTLESLVNFVHERGLREGEVFTLANENHRILKKAFLDQLASLDGQDPVSEFRKIAVRWPDGSFRSPENGFDGTKSDGIFVGAGNREMTADLRRRVVAMHRVVALYGRAWHSRFQDTYIILPENAISLYWPEDPDWVFQITPGFDLTREIYFTVSDKARDPERQTVWTGLYFDKVSKAWMASAETPVDDAQGRHIATIGHDVMLDALVERTVNRAFAGSYNIIFTQKGALIAHPEKLARLMDVGRSVSIDELSDPWLTKIFQAVKGASTGTSLVELADQYLASTRIPGGDWIFVTVLPKSVMRDKAIGSARYILLLGFFALLVELLLLYSVLQRKVTLPLGKFVSAADAMRSGLRPRDLDVTRRDEIGKLARSFLAMDAVVRTRDRQLAAHNRELEERVKERTRELDLQRAAAVAAAKLASLGEMASGIAHEINNPLAIIHGNATHLNSLATRGKLDPAKAQQIASKILLTSDRIAKIVRGLRSFSREGSEDPFLAATIAKIISETLDFCQIRFKSSGVDLRVSPVSETLEIECRAVQISQVILNLLNNAFDAVFEMPDPWVALDVREMDWEVEISVTDSGNGIPPEVAEKIMQPFFTTKEIGKGTGLGLSIASGIVRSHGGSLSLDLESKNTRFVIRLPKKRPEVV